MGPEAASEAPTRRLGAHAGRSWAMPQSLRPRANRTEGRQVMLPL